MKDFRQIKVTTIIYSVLLVLLFMIVVLGVLAYGFESSNRFVRRAEKIIPLPVALVNYTHWIPIGDFYDNVQSVRRFYENQDFSKLGIRIDFNTPDGQKRLKVKERQVLNKMIEDKAVEILSQKEGVTVTAQILSDNVDKKLEEYGTRETVEANLTRLYGWTIEDFKNKVVRPALYREELEKVFDQKYTQSESAKQKILQAEAAISKKEKSFSDIVKEFSDGSSVQTGGELGWFKKDQIVPEIADQIFSLSKGQRSAILESKLGFHIVEVEDRKKDGTTELVRIRQIFVAKKTFADWLGDQMKLMKIFIPLRSFYWDKDGLVASFQSQEMNDFEKKLIESKDAEGIIF